MAAIEHTFQFNLKNTATGQDAVTITVAGRGAASMNPVIASSPYDFTAPMRVYGVKSATITQSTSELRQLNTLTVRFSLHTPLPLAFGGNLVTISGLVGSATPTNVQQIISQQRQPLDTPISREASFLANTGTLYLNIDGLSGPQIQAFYEAQANADPDSPRATIEYVFSFTLLNPDVGQLSPQMRMGASGSGWCARDLLSPYFLTPGPGYEAPLLVADFEGVTMYQSTASVATLNLVTLAFYTVGLIPAGTKITVEGLYCVRCGNVPEQVAPDALVCCTAPCFAFCSVENKSNACSLVPAVSVTLAFSHTHFSALWCCDPSPQTMKASGTKPRAPPAAAQSSSATRGQESHHTPFPPSRCSLSRICRHRQSCSFSACGTLIAARTQAHSCSSLPRRLLRGLRPQTCRLPPRCAPSQLLDCPCTTALQQLTCESLYAPVTAANHPGERKISTPDSQLFRLEHRVAIIGHCGRPQHPKRLLLLQVCP